MSDSEDWDEDYEEDYTVLDSEEDDTRLIQFSFWDQRENSPWAEFSDLTLLVGKEKYRMECHKIILSVCPFFRKRLTVNHCEVSPGRNHQILEIDKEGEEGLSKDMVKAVIRYIYLFLGVGSFGRESLQLLTDDTVGIEMDIFRLALAWELPILAKRCAIHLTTNIDAGNYEELLLFAEKQKIRDVWLAVREYIQKNANTIHRKVTESRLGCTRCNIFKKGILST